MICYIDNTTDPYYNLAVEEYLFKECDQPVFRLWQNSPSVIVGRYQNAIAEINQDYIRKNHIPVVRRLTGGGAVFHDLGNINFTFIDKKIGNEDSSAMFRRFTAPIISALKELGVNAYLEGRNDLLIDGCKFSGNAIAVYKDRVLQHGTLLFSASMPDLAQALNTRPEKFQGKNVKSNISRVTNISSHLPESHKGMSTGEFMQYLKDYIMKTDYVSGEYSDYDVERCTELRNTKYCTDEWTYGKSPEYKFSNSIKLPCGFVEVHMDVENAIIKDIDIQGDYFFLKPTEEIKKALEGTRHSHDDIHAALEQFDLSEYFGKDMTSDILTSMFF